jgi:hypothetical protein
MMDNERIEMADAVDNRYLLYSTRCSVAVAVDEIKDG